MTFGNSRTAPTGLSRRDNLKIAQRFNAGFTSMPRVVPKGRLKSRLQKPTLLLAATNKGVTFGGFNRPFGTHPTGNLDPAVNCRAIVDTPSGRRRMAAQSFKISETGDSHASYWSFSIGLWFFFWILSFELGA